VRHVIFSAAFTVSGTVKICTIILLLQANLTKLKCDLSFINAVVVIILQRWSVKSKVIYSCSEFKITLI